MCWWICGPESDNDADNVHDDDDDDDCPDNDCCIPFSDDGPTCLLIPQLTISSVPPSCREPEQRGATDGFHPQTLKTFLSELTIGPTRFISFLSLFISVV